MLKQEYNAKAFLSVIQKEDVLKKNLWKEKTDPAENASTFAKNLKEKSFTLDELQKFQRGDMLTCSPSKPEDLFALRLVDRYLRRIYKVSQSDRGKIIRQIRVLLEDQGQFCFMRRDINKFYESVDFSKCIEKIKTDMILSPQGVSILSSLQTQYHAMTQKKSKGLPRGVCVSATLSELYLRDLDKAIAACPDILYSARYVDDFFLLVDKDKLHSIEEMLEKELQQLDLTFNKTKSITKDISESCSFSFLGYEFEIKAQNFQKPKTVLLKIAPQKVKKIKQRIYRSLADCSEENNLSDLLKRLRYLSCCKVIKKSKNGRLLAGNAYNYRYITDPAYFKVFDAFIYKHLDGSSFSDEAKKKIQRISFYYAFKNKLVANFTFKQIAHLKKIWAHER